MNDNQIDFDEVSKEWRKNNSQMSDFNTYVGVQLLPV